MMLVDILGYCVSGSDGWNGWVGVCFLYYYIWICLELRRFLFINSYFRILVRLKDINY